MGGQSEDGRGPGKYIGKTTDAKEAKTYWKKMQGNPYSTGKVVALAEFEEKTIWNERDWVNFL